MMMELTAKSKVGFVNGTILYLLGIDDHFFITWNHFNIMILSWILNSISNEIAFSMIYASTYVNVAQFEWTFIKCNGPHFFFLQEAISSLSRDYISVIVYYTCLKAIWDELIKCCSFLNFTRGSSFKYFDILSMKVACSSIFFSRLSSNFFDRSIIIY